MKKRGTKNILSALTASNKPFYMQWYSWVIAAAILVVILFLIFRPAGIKSSPGTTTSAGEYIVEITGTYAIGYDGQIISGPNVLDIKGIILNKTVTYTVQGSPVIVNLEKPGQLGTVSVSIKRGNTVLKSGTTSAPYGTINITASYY